MTARPPFVDEWPALARVAQLLLDQRIAGYPAQIARARMTQALADDGLRTMRAVAAIWRAVVDRQDIDERDPIAALGASWAEMRADLSTTATRAAGRAAAAMREGVADPDDFAACVAALAWQAQGWKPGADIPHIVFIHNTNQRLRRQRDVADPARQAA